MTKVFIIGLPAAGKTHFGRELALRMNLPFADLDRYIEKKEGKTITEIFNLKGESYFRQLEQLCLAELADARQAGMVVACGGGTPAYYDNLTRMKQNGIVIFLDTDRHTIAARLAKNSDSRPLLSGTDTKQKLEDLYRERKPYYEQADIRVEGDEKTGVNFEKIIELCTNRQ